jgi:hypothetical protein
MATWKDFFESAIPLCGKRDCRSCISTAPALAALLRMRHDCGNSDNQAAIQSQAIKGGLFR